MSPKAEDPITWGHFIAALLASITIFGCGVAVGFWSTLFSEAWAGFAVAAAGAVALPQFLLGYWADTSEARTAAADREAVEAQNAKVHRVANWFWYGALVLLVVFSGVLVGIGLK